MPLYYCGFNAFGQFPNSESMNVTNFSLYPVEDACDALFSWGYMIFKTSKEEVYISGLVHNSSRILKKLEFPTETKILKMSCSSFQCHVLFISSSGECFMYNGTDVKKLVKFTSIEQIDSGDLTDDLLVQVSCGENINLAISSKGIVYSIPSPILLTPQVKVTNVACGFEHNLLLTETGGVFSWGIGSRGQLGHGELDDADVPRQLTTLSGISITRISAGGWHSAVIDDLGELWSWGWNSEGQLGFPSMKTLKSPNHGDCDELDIVNVSATPTTVPFACEFRGKIVDVACGNRHTISLSDDGSVWGCGWNEFGQLAKPDAFPNLSRMTKLDTPSGKITTVLCGAWSSAILVDT